MISFVSIEAGGSDESYVHSQVQKVTMNLQILLQSLDRRGLIARTGGRGGGLIMT